MIIPPTWAVPESAAKRVGQNSYGRQRAIYEEGHLLLILHKAPGADDSGREGVIFWRNPAGEWQVNRGGNGPGSLKRHIQSYAELETQLATAFDAADSTTALFDLLESLSPLARAAHNQHLAVQSARELVKNDGFLIEMRDLAYEVDRTYELLLEDVRNAIHYRMARESEEQGRLTREALHASHRLNILAALFFPLTAITSLFGMNLQHGLDEHKTSIFWAVAGGAVVLGWMIKGWVLADKEPPDKT